MLPCFRAAAIAFLVIAASGSGVGTPLAHEVVPGPFGEIVDHQKPLSFNDQPARVRYARQQAMRAFSAHFRSIEAVVSYGAQLDDLMPLHADALDKLGSMVPRLFAAEAPMEPGKHGARPDIWARPAEFARHVTGFQDAAAGLRLAVTEKRSLAEPLLAVRHQCLACHQQFRVFAPQR